MKASEAAITNIDAQIELQRSVIGQAQASVDASNASLVFAKSEAQRNTRLISTGAGTQSRAEQSRSLMDQATAAVQRDEAALIAAHDRVPVLKSQRDQAVAQRDEPPRPHNKPNSTSPTRVSSQRSTEQSAHARSALDSMSPLARS